MKPLEIELPSNRRFGFFFTLVFSLCSTYFFHAENIQWAFIFMILSTILLLITFIKNDVLLPLNKLWMQFGLLLGKIINPIVLGVIFFGLFTPTAILLRLSGRDELRLKFGKKKSHWKTRHEPIRSKSFKYQF